MSAGVRRPTAIVGHGVWGRGGAEAAAMWIISALSEAFEVTIYTRGGFDLEALNRLAGTSLATEALTLRRANVESSLPVGALAAGRFLRSLRRVAGHYDLCVSASGILPWGRPALHFLSSIDCDPDLVRRYCHADRMPLRARLSRLIQYTVAGARQPRPGDHFVANSEWLKEKCVRVCSGPVEVIHPAVVLPSMGMPWRDRDNAVLAFGRISPEKRVEACIRIVERARALGFGGQLIIAGPDGPLDYTHHIRKLAAAREWITLLPSQTGAERDALLGRVRYGLNACLYEAFGISSAEMAGAGVIMLVPQGTGQSEIVKDSLQHYATEVAAAELLVALDQNVVLRERLHQEALTTRERFAPVRFVDAVQNIAKQALRVSEEARNRTDVPPSAAAAKGLVRK